MSDREEALNMLAKEYKKETGIDLKFELYAPTSAYTAKIRSAAQADKLPDVYGILLEMRDFASFIKAGHVLDLTAVMKADDSAWEKRFYKSGLAMNIFLDGNQYGVVPGIYGAPLDINNIQFIYNLDLLKKAGWDLSSLPSTWD
ncbi:MAG: extracellular solute-binding protein, partial [Candidatus Omnitrophota bacterium]